MPAEFRVLFVEDEEENAAIALGALGDVLPSGRSLTVRVEPDFNAALGLIAEQRPDLLILDVMQQDTGEGLGESVLAELRKVLFAPVVFYTANPHLVEMDQSDFVRIVPKITGAAALRDVVFELAESRLPRLRSALTRFSDAALAGFMWQFVEEHWAAMEHHADDAIESMMARALANSLSRSVPTPAGLQAAEPAKADPLFYYHFVRPVDGKRYAGEVLQDPTNGAWYVLLSPSCRMHRQGPNLGCVLARAWLLTETAQYAAYRDMKSDANKSKLKLMLDSKVPEQHFLPSAVVVPALVVDFTSLSAVPQSQLSDFAFVAQLASPYAEHMEGRFGAYFANVGTPVLAVDGWIADVP